VPPFSKVFVAVAQIDVIMILPATPYHLYVIVEHQVVLSVPLQQCEGMLHLKVLKLQHSVWPPPHHRTNKLQTKMQHDRAHRKPSLASRRRCILMHCQAWHPVAR
jgi:hypothetical protein